MLVLAVFTLIEGVRGHVRQQRAHRVPEVALGLAEIAIYAGSDAGSQRRAEAAGLLHLRQLNAQAADVRQHLHPDVGVGRSAGNAQGANVGKTFTHAVEVGHMAEDHAS